MRLIQNTNVAFRCPDSLKEKLEVFAVESDVHVSVVIRSACVAYLKENAPHLLWTSPSRSEDGSAASSWFESH